MPGTSTQQGSSSTAVSGSSCRPRLRTPRYASVAHREVCGADTGSGRRRSPRTVADLRRRYCDRAGVRLERFMRRVDACSRDPRSDARGCRATPCDSRNPAVGALRTPVGSVCAHREVRQHVQPNDRVARGLLDYLPEWWRQRARNERVAIDGRLFLERPERSRTDTWRMPGSLRRPRHPRSIPFELLLWPRFDAWTKLSLEPQRGVRVGRRYFANGHQALDALCAELIHGLTSVSE